MKKRSLLALFLAILMVLSMALAGCGQGSEPAAQEGTPVSQAETPADTPAASTVASTTDDFGRKDPGSYKTKLEFMAHSKQLEGMVNRFMEKYPGIDVEFTIIPGAEHLNQIMTRVNSGNLPDIFTGKTEFIKYITNVPNCFADLSSAPFRGEEVAKQLVPYIGDLSRDKDGKLRCISWQATVGGIYYRRSIAKQYFGTDVPEEIDKLVSSWDKVKETAQVLKEKSGGKVKMFANYASLLNPFMSERSGSWIDKNGKLFIDETVVRNYFETSKYLWDNENLARTQDDSEFIGTMQNGNVFMYTLPTWGLNFQIMPNAPDTSGDWGLAIPPEPYFRGGTWLGIGYNGKHLEESYMLLEYMLTDEDNVYQYALDDGDYVSNLAVQKRVGSMPESEAANVKSFKFMGGQNIYSFYNKLLEKSINADLISEQDVTLEKLLGVAATAYVEEGKTFEQALQQFKDEAFNYLPELK